jgi:hypothetical protein
VYSLVLLPVAVYQPEDGHEKANGCDVGSYAGGESVPVFAAFSAGVANLARAGIVLMIFGQSELNSSISVGASLQLGDTLSTLSWAAFGSSVSIGSF